MVKVNSFRALRPVKEKAHEIICPPYDVVDTEEARTLAGDNQNSFLHIVRSEIDFPEGHNPYDEEIYAKAKANLERLVFEGLMKRDAEPSVFVYRLDANGKSQYGLVSCLHVDDYTENRILKHEFTRREKEDDRTKHIDTVGANTGLIYLMYRNSALPELAEILETTASGEPLYDITENEVRHRIYGGGENIQRLISSAEKLSGVYIADGHHRAASSARVANLRRERAGTFDGNEQFNWFLTVLFPDHLLNILPYNRAVADLNGLSADLLISGIEKKGFSVKEGRKERLDLHEFNMYLSGKWHTLTANPELYSDADEVSLLDVSILQNHILGPLLGVDDPRTSEKIKFVGGIRGEAELEKLVDSGKFSVSFSLHPVSTSQLMSISDAGKVMPPKST
ncbi:MAG: DUF1015 family protein, partial [Spirochaetia bacterium]|nr:DUF1015 family protein [Spirochaetia bacterium]